MDANCVLFCGNQEVSCICTGVYGEMFDRRGMSGEFCTV